MKKIFLFLSLISFFIYAPSAYTASSQAFSLGKVDGHGVESGQIDTLKALIKSEIVSHENTSYVEGKNSTVIDATITKLDKQILVVLNSRVGLKILQSERTKIDSWDEIDVVVKRLVTALIENKPLEETAERGVVLGTEQQSATRVKSISGWTFALGGGFPMTNSLGSYKPMFAFGGGYGWDVDHFLVELRADFQVGYNDADMNVSSFSLGGHYIWLDQRKIAAYSGIDLGFASAEDNVGTSKNGFALGGNTGILLLRNADINLDLRFRLMTITDKLNNSVPVIGSTLIGIRF